MDFTFPDLTS